VQEPSEIPPPPSGQRWVPEPPWQARRRRPLHPLVNLVCFLATVVSTLVAGTLMTLDDFSLRTMWDILLSPSYWTLGAPYSFCLLLILGSHEMGHYVACRLYRIDASLPFFLPAPHLFGTFGAVIRIRAPFTHRRALFDVGVAGPIAGFVIALPVLLYGLAHSTLTREPPQPGEIGLGSCLLLEFLQPLFFHAGPGASIRLHPVFMAAWLGLFATALNLLPIGQLDGGHMLYAISPRLHETVSRFGIPSLIVLGIVSGGYQLVTIGLFFAILGRRHPPCLQESERLGRGRLGVAWLALAIFVLCFILQPLQTF
jgi:membrane-associated protease RseP (regulator of RpoE activity)